MEMSKLKFSRIGDDMITMLERGDYNGYEDGADRALSDALATMLGHTRVLKKHGGLGLDIRVFYDRLETLEEILSRRIGEWGRDRPIQVQEQLGDLSEFISLHG